MPDYLVAFAKHVLPEGAIVKNYSDAKKKYDDKRTGISTRWIAHTAMRTHPVDYAFHMLVDIHAEIKDKNYLKIRPDEIELPSDIILPEHYIVIAATATERIKTMPNETINEIVQYIISKGYVPVFIGKSESPTGEGDNKIKGNKADIDYSIGLNFLDKTDLLQTAKIIEGAQALVSMDGGIVHVGGCTNTSLIVGYTFIDGKKHNIPIRNNEMGWNSYIVEPEKSLGCRFCQSNMNLVYNWDFRKCYYGPDDYTCLKHMTSEKFIKGLEKFI